MIARATALFLLLAIAGCAALASLNFTARDVVSDDLYVGTFRANLGEPVSVVSLFSVGSDAECRGTTGVGGAHSVTRSTPTRLTMRCSDDRILRGELTLERADRGTGTAKDTRDGAVYQVLFKPLDLYEQSLRRKFAALPVPVEPTPPPPPAAMAPEPKPDVRPFQPCRGERVDGQCLVDFGDSERDINQFRRRPNDRGIET